MKRLILPSLRLVLQSERQMWINWPHFLPGRRGTLDKMARHCGPVLSRRLAGSSRRGPSPAGAGDPRSRLGAVAAAPRLRCLRHPRLRGRPCRQIRPGDGGNPGRLSWQVGRRGDPERPWGRGLGVQEKQMGVRWAKEGLGAAGRPRHMCGGAVMSQRGAVNADR